MGFIVLKQRKRIQKRIANTLKKREATRKHNQWLRDNNLAPDQLKTRAQDRESLRPGIPDYKTKKKMPRTSDRITKMSGRAEAQQYSGERKLLGIAIMHKSNLVPVFDKETAEEISKMRRN